jgi:hypothetical protein
MRLTPKARAFLHAAFRKAGLDAPDTGRRSTGIAVVQVPPRPFIAPVFEGYAADADEVSIRFLNAWPPIWAVTSAILDCDL